LKQSFAWWTFKDKGLEPEDLIKTAAEIGYQGVELIDEVYFPLVKDYGLTIATHGTYPSIEVGLNDRSKHADIVESFEQNLKIAVEWEIPTLIACSGNKNALTKEEGIEAIVEVLQQMLPRAEDAGVALVLELMNSKVDHPDQQCNNTQFAIEVSDRVDSKNFSILYDIYHMQIMEGDVIRTIQSYSDYFGHYHTAGNPGRHEIGLDQEINYTAIFREIKKTDYQGFIGHEFVPTGDVKSGLQEAFEICKQA